MRMGGRVVQNADAFALALAVCVVLLRMLCAWTLNYPLRGDYLAYFTMAQRLSEGAIIKDHFGNLAYYNVGYPLVLGLAFTLFGASVRVAWVLNALLGGASVYLVYRLAKRITADAGVGLLAAGIWAVYIAAYVYSAYVAKENLTVLLFLSQCLLVVRFNEWRHPRVAALALGGLTGFHALAGSSSLAVVPILVWVVWTHGNRGVRRAQVTAIFILAGLLAAAPWLARNAQVLGKPVLNSNGGFNLYLGNNPAATGYFVSIADTPLASDWHVLRRSGELHADHAAGRAAIEYIRSHPLRTAALSVKKMVAFWWPPLHEGKRQVHPMENLLRKVWLGQYLAMVGLAFAGAWALPGTLRRRALPVLAMIAAYALLHAIFYVIYRYRLPVIPPVAVLAAMAANEFVARWRTKRVRNDDGCNTCG